MEHTLRSPLLPTLNQNLLRYYLQELLDPHPLELAYQARLAKRTNLESVGMIIGSTSSTVFAPIQMICADRLLIQAAIVAEYLAHGYVLGDNVIQHAIDFDRRFSLTRTTIANRKTRKLIHAI